MPTVLDLSAYVGLAAVGAVTLNMLLGTLMAFRYSPVRQWPHRRFNYFRLHNLSGYAALSLAVLPQLGKCLHGGTSRRRERGDASCVVVDDE
jgi:hypothetical protein